MRKKIFEKMCKNFNCLTFVEKGYPRDHYGLVFTLQFVPLTSCLCHLLSQWSSRDGSSSDMVLVRLWRQSAESLDRSLMFLHLMFLASLLFTGLSKDSIPQTQQFPSLKRRMELVDQWQDAALRILTLSDNPSPKQGISPSEFCQFKMTFLRQQFKGFFVRICAGFRTSQILSSLFLIVTFKRETGHHLQSWLLLGQRRFSIRV